MTTVTVAINATALLSPLTGIGHYVRSLAQALAAGGEAGLHYFYGTGWSTALRDAPVPRIVAGKAAVKKLVPRAYEVMRFIQQRRFNAGIRRLPGAVYHEPNFLAFDCERPTVITAHDLSWRRYPHTQPPERVRVLDARFGPALARCAHVITDAESVRREIIDEYAVAPQRITAVPLAPRGIFRPREEAGCASTIGRLDLAWRHYFLCVGTLEPRKNLQLAVRAYAGLPAPLQNRFPLVVAGMKGWLTSDLERTLAPLAASGHVRLIGYVDDDALAALYAAARVLVYPSLYEGFGLPPLEAMASGTPVIASNCSSLPEVVGDAGVLVDPVDAEALRAAMRELAEDDRRWEALRSAGLARAAQFSWARCARETLAVYRQVLA